MKKLLAALVFLSSVLVAQAQIAGMAAYSVLEMPSSARIAGLGFDYISLYDNDVSLALGNPSLVSPRLSHQLSVGFVNAFAGANFGSVAYSHHFKRLGAFTFGLQYDSYGQFQGYDEYEQSTGSFSAADYVMTIGWGRAIDDNVCIGANFKPILSHYETYTAFAFGIDLAVSYFSTNRSFALTALGRNIGAQIYTFDGLTERLPFELSLAGSYKLQDAPFRIHFALNELQKWDLTYDDELNPSSSTDPFTGEVVTRSALATFADKAFRHLGVGVELSIRKTFFAVIGYNYRQMAEMQAAEAFNLSGFSFGFGINVKGFRVCYSRNNYHLSQAPNFISVTTSLDRFFR